MPVELASALVVDDVRGVVGFGGEDVREVGAAWEPPAPLPVEVLDLAALPWRVGVTEPAFDAVGVRDGGPVRPFRSLIEGDRFEEPGWDTEVCPSLPRRLAWK